MRTHIQAFRPKIPETEDGGGRRWREGEFVIKVIAKIANWLDNVGAVETII